MKEYWRTVVIDGVEHPRYKVSNLGRVKCLDWKYTGKEKICKLSVDSYGYLVACIDGASKKAHRIVAETFLPCPNPDRNCIDHRNTIKTDNFVFLADDGQTVIDSNIWWVSPKENSNNPLTKKHLSENNATPMLGKLGADCPNSVPIVQLSKDGQFIKKWCAAMEVQRELGINHGDIAKCCRGKLKSAGGFKWMYATDYNPVNRSISEIRPLFKSYK
jgi:NUMOD4 motif.